MDSHYDVQMTPADYALMQYQYDNRGRQTSIEDALSQEEEYTYDNAGNLTLTDRNGRYTVYTYDVRGNVLTESIYADMRRTRHPS